jgi:hypothetical protein
VFDADNPDILRKAVRNGIWRDWTNGVAAVRIVPPPWRDQEEPVCIEMLYEPETLAKPSAAGQRIYLLEEFDKRNGHHLEQGCNTPHPRNKALVRDEVYDFKTGEQLAMSKGEFASAVREGRLGSVSFKGFRPTVKAILDALQGMSRADAPARSDAD